jgi:hypothetical protein
MQLRFFYRFFYQKNAFREKVGLKMDSAASSGGQERLKYYLGIR